MLSGRHEVSLVFRKDSLKFKRQSTVNVAFLLRVRDVIVMVNDNEIGYINGGVNERLRHSNATYTEEI